MAVSMTCLTTTGQRAFGRKGRCFGVRCREVGARVSTNVFVRDLDIAMFIMIGSRRLGGCCRWVAPFWWSSICDRHHVGVRSAWSASVTGHPHTELLFNRRPMIGSDGEACVEVVVLDFAICHGRRSHPSKKKNHLGIHDWFTRTHHITAEEISVHRNNWWLRSNTVGSDTMPVRH